MNVLYSYFVMNDNFSSGDSILYRRLDAGSGSVSPRLGISGPSGAGVGGRMVVGGPGARNYPGMSPGHSTVNRATPGFANNANISQGIEFFWGDGGW